MLRVLLVLLVASLWRCEATLEQLCETDRIDSKCICGYNPYKSQKHHYVVDCARTDLDVLPDNRQFPPHFTVLEVSHNNIKDLALENGDFESKSLRILQASYNQITEISPEFLKGVPSLTRLDVSHNKITKLDNAVFEGVPNLHHLDISFNDIATLPNKLFKPAKALKFLDISYNEKLGVQLNAYENLRDSPLKLTENLTTFIANNVNLTKISKVYFENTTITTLSLADNGFTEIPLLPKNLEYLDLSGNLFKFLEPHHFYYPKLKIFKLNRLKQLYTVEKYTFYSMQALETLSIENCMFLKYFDSLAFGVLLDEESWNLKEISLAGNGLRSINQTYFKLFNKLKKVNLDDNPWDCDCHVLWYQLLGEKLVHRNLRCASPGKYRDREILSITEKELPNCAMGASWRNHQIMVILISVLVVTLMALVLYLIYMGPYFRNYRRSSPMSVNTPYNSLILTDD